MLCPKCGKDNNYKGVQFCTNCGFNLSSPQQEPTVVLPDLSNDSGSRRKLEQAKVLIGQVIDGKYRLNKILGVGGMGAVYNATRLHIGDEVAVKILHPESHAEPTSSERFRREAQMAARLKHPNAVGIYDFGVTANGLIYLVMELVNGSSLRQIIKEQGPLAINTVADITSQVCAALDEAHRQGIVHRDIKPENIVVSATANGIQVKVLDFGVAKMRDLATGNLTQAGMILGTPRYMSPEQCMGEELDGRSDIYSFGIVLYEMLCGAVPFNSPASTAIAVQHVTQTPPSLRVMNASISPAVETVVINSLNKQREARPQSAGALSQQLTAAVYGNAVSTQQTYSSGAFFQPAVTQQNAPRPSQDMPTAIISNSFSGSNVPTSPPTPAYSTQSATIAKSSSKLPLIIAGVVFMFLLFIGTITAIIVLPKLLDNSNNPNDNRGVNVNNKQDNKQPEKTPTPNQTPTPTADSEYNQLREKILSSVPAQHTEIEKELLAAERKYPTDYRFPYERAKLTANETEHHETFEALYEAGKKAIENGKADAMLADLQRDTATSFRRLSTHREWKVLLTALTNKDAEDLKGGHH